MRSRRTSAPALACLLFTACGGVSVTSSTPPPAAPPAGAAVVKITASGVVPALLHMFQRGAVTFANNDSRTHEVRSAAGNVDSRCELVGVGAVAPSERRQTVELPPGLNCAYVDGSDPANAAFRGVIVTH